MRLLLEEKLSPEVTDEVSGSEDSPLENPPEHSRREYIMPEGHITGEAYITCPKGKYHCKAKAEVPLGASA